MLAADTAQWGSAEHHLGRALELAERSGSGRSVARTNEELARMALARADLETASALACQATYANRDAGHAMNWMRCAALLADVHIELGEYRRAHAVLDEVRPAVTTYAGLARRAFAPREARIERLNGNPDAAAHHLAAIAALETAYPLDPNRVVYLVEAACLASANSSRRATLVSTLATTAERRGLALPLCEQQRLAALEG